MDVLLMEAREALLQRRGRLSARGEAGGARLTEAERAELRRIDEALERMEGGDFGRCARCGGAIGRHRLRAIPEARYCMTCSDRVASEAALPPGSRELPLPLGEGGG